MERDSLPILKMDVVLRATKKAIPRIFKALISKQIPKVNANVVLHRGEK